LKLTGKAKAYFKGTVIVDFKPITKKYLFIYVVNPPKITPLFQLSIKMENILPLPFIFLIHKNKAIKTSFKITKNELSKAKLKFPK